MDLKTVSGVVVTRGHKEGRVVIDFGSNDIVGGDLETRDLRKEVTVAPRGMRRSYFDDDPSHTVGLREGSQHGQIQDNTIGPTTIYLIDDHFTINSSANAQRLTIDWKGAGSARVEEITYLAIGPVSPPPPGPD